MKNKVSILMAMVLLLLWSGCTGEVFTETEPVVPSSGRVISFDNGFVDNSVRTRATTPLSQHHVTMGVWGWETNPSGVDNLLFVNQLVKYLGTDGDANDWTYNPLKYWNDGNKYRFYAYAPYDSTHVSIDAANGRISIRDIVLSGANLQQSASDALKDNFHGSGDTDWMVARGGQAVPGTYRAKVNFNMNHILAKFVAAVRIGSDLANDPEKPQVTVTGLTIGHFASKGSFVQQFDHTPNPEDSTEMALPEWTLDETAMPYDLVNDSVVTAQATNTYLVESLLLPQTVDSTAEMKLSYTIAYSDGRTERFVRTMDLDEAFGHFCGGCCYTVTFTVNPRAISFDSGVSTWQNEYGGGTALE